MKVRHALRVAGSKPLSEFVWGNDLVLAISGYFPTTDALSSSATGAEVLERIGAFGDDVSAYLLELDIQPKSHPSIVRDPASIAPPEVVTTDGKLKITLGGFLTMSFGLMVVTAGFLLVTGLNFSDPNRTDEEKIGIFSQLGKALIEILSAFKDV